MHIPDGFLNAATAATMGGLSAASLGLALFEAKRRLEPKRVPMLGLSAAFVFAAQMLNFPVAGGTSGHLIGGTLTAVLLGPSAAVVVISAVLIVQCFLFADGGVTALGANIFNMAVIGGVVGWLIYRGIRMLLPRKPDDLFATLLAAMVAAWCSTVLASVFCAAQLAASGTVAWKLALLAMAGVHMLIGVGEGLITAAALAAVAATRPELLANQKFSIKNQKSLAPLLAYGLIISLALAMFVSPFASSWPDGLDRTAEDLNFAGAAVTQPMVPAPAADYELGASILPGAWATGVAGAVGTVVVFVLAWFTARALTGKKPAVDAGAAA
ncbi:MAG: PDGLE domain-containing protein [Phycisphaeraceae bacterium]|nr:PDGLE domain-containing protein [Phycisphaeraceae bacterium]